MHCHGHPADRADPIPVHGACGSRAVDGHTIAMNKITHLILCLGGFAGKTPLPYTNVDRWAILGNRGLYFSTRYNTAFAH